MIQDDLIDLADHLARLERGRPRQTSLRRAVSTAYYAVFHALAFLCVDALVGWKKPWEACTPVYRALDHSAPKRLLVRDREGMIIGQEALAILRAFTTLQEARQGADYDPEPFSPRRHEVLELIDVARQAVQAVRVIPAEKRLLLAVHLITKPR